MAERDGESKEALRTLMEEAKRRGIDLATLIAQLKDGQAPADDRSPERAEPAHEDLAGWQLGMVRAVEVEAVKVFGKEAGADFMRRGHSLLDGRRPLDVAAESTAGTERVLELLGRIKYGSAS